MRYVHKINNGNESKMNAQKIWPKGFCFYQYDGLFCFLYEAKPSRNRGINQLGSIRIEYKIDTMTYISVYS